MTEDDFDRLWQAVTDNVDDTGVFSDQLYAFARALLALAGERVIAELNTLVVVEPMADDIIRRILGVKGE